MVTAKSASAKSASADAASSASEGHNDFVAQPHDAQVEPRIAEAEAAAARMQTEDEPLGRLGRPFNKRSPFFIGMAAAAGVAATYAIIQLILLAGHVLIVIGLSLFLAIGIEPAVSFLAKRKVPRWLAVVIVLVVIVGAIGGFIAAAIPAVVTQVQQLITNIPGYIQQINDHNSFLGQLNDRFGVLQKVQSLLSTDGSALFSGLLGAGVLVFSTIADALIVAVLTIYLLVDLPRVRAFGYRLVPRDRRPRTILIGDDILAKVGGYVLGNLIISAIAGLLTFGWLLIFGVPYAVLLALLVALLDLVPVVGSTIAGIVVAAVALTVSLPVCLATIGFFVVYRLAEDYFLVPRIIGRAVHVPALLTVVAVLVGAALLGVLGALVAIPVAAALLLVVREVLIPRLDGQ